MGEKEEMKEMFQELTGFEKKNISPVSYTHLDVYKRQHLDLQSLIC